MRNTWNKAVYKEIQVMDMEQIIREKLVEIEKSLTELSETEIDLFRNGSKATC